MNKQKPPSKEVVRQWLLQQIASRCPPDRDEIRRALGWGLMAAQGRKPDGSR